MIFYFRIQSKHQKYIMLVISTAEFPELYILASFENCREAVFRQLLNPEAHDVYTTSAQVPSCHM